MDAELFRSLQILALKSVESPSFQDFYNHICRWYSREFHVPLPDVESMAMEAVLLTYFEDNLYRLRQDDSEEGQQKYEDLKREILGIAEAEAQKSEEEDDEWYRQELERLQQKEDAKAPEPQKATEKQQHTPTKKPSRKPQDAREVIENPNLFKDEFELPDFISVKVFDDPFEDED